MVETKEYRALVETVEKVVGENGYYPSTSDIGDAMDLSPGETAARLRVVDRAYRTVLDENRESYGEALNGYDGELDQSQIPAELPETLIWSKSSTTRLNGVLFEALDGLAEDIAAELGD